jgi:hypothetical protein
MFSKILKHLVNEENKLRKKHKHAFFDYLELKCEQQYCKKNQYTNDTLSRDRWVLSVPLISMESEKPILIHQIRIRREASGNFKRSLVRFLESSLNNASLDINAKSKALTALSLMYVLDDYVRKCVSETIQPIVTSPRQQLGYLIGAKNPLLHQMPKMNDYLVNTDADFMEMNRYYAFTVNREGIEFIASDTFSVNKYSVSSNGLELIFHGDVRSFLYYVLQADISSRIRNLSLQPSTDFRL